MLGAEIDGDFDDRLGEQGQDRRSTDLLEAGHYAGELIRDVVTEWCARVNSALVRSVQSKCVVVESKSDVCESLHVATLPRSIRRARRRLVPTFRGARCD